MSNLVSFVGLSIRDIINHRDGFISHAKVEKFSTGSLLTVVWDNEFVPFEGELTPEKMNSLRQAPHQLISTISSTSAVDRTKYILAKNLPRVYQIEGEKNEKQDGT